MDLHPKAAFFVVLAILSSVSCQTGKLCVTKLPTRRGLLFSFLQLSNQDQIPLDYSAGFTFETECIVFMELNWDEDVQLQFAPFNVLRSPERPSVKIITVADQSSLFGVAVQDKIITGITEMVISGNSTRSFAMVFSKMSPPFLFTFKTTNVRELVCPDLETEFSSVSCSNGRSVGSNCTFQCPSGFYPAPDLFGPIIPVGAIQKFQSSGGREFFSTCSVTAERRRPAWRPDAITPLPSQFGTYWPSIPYFWKCVEVQLIKDICLVSRNTFFRELREVVYRGRSGFEISSYVTLDDCNYPPEFLLTIFDEERNENITTPEPPSTTTATTTTTTTTMIEESGFSFGSAAIVPPMVAGREAVDGFPTIDCSVHCKFDSTVGRFLPLCGNIEDEDKLIDCLTCRYTGEACTDVTPVA